MYQAIAIVEIVVGWMIILSIWFTMVDMGLFEEFKELISDIRRRLSRWL